MTLHKVTSTHVTSTQIKTQAITSPLSLPCAPPSRKPPKVTIDTILTSNAIGLICLGFFVFVVFLFVCLF